VTTVSAPSGQGAERTFRSRSRDRLGNNVAATIAGLQRRLLLPHPHAEAVAALAKLRRGLGREPGFDYTLGIYLSIPDSLLNATPSGHVLGAHHIDEGEYAKHVAVTHYALHQQSKRVPMHVDGRGFGEAVSLLTKRAAGPEGIRRRFAALGTASSFDEALHHLRGLVLLLREQAIALDYGLLAGDLLLFQRSGGRTRVQAMWGREFFRNNNHEESGSDTSIDTTTDDETDEEQP
jgi:CRISPR system Cascade subunit CasB